MIGLKKKSRKILIIGIFLLIFSIGFLSYRMITMDLSVNFDFNTVKPESVSLANVGSSVNDVRWAAAVDGNIVAGRSDEIVQSTASTTKMILALAVLEKKPLAVHEKGEMIKITREMYNKYVFYLNNNGSNTAVYEGEEISEYDALVSLMLASSNNMADALAVWAFGSMENYREYGMEMLGRLGIKNTTLGTRDASGYDAGTTSTAADLARIGYFVMKNEILSEIVALGSAEVPVAGVIKNTNMLLGKSLISGVKTGFIGEESGYCIVSGYKKDGNIVTVAVLDANTRQESFDENLKIVDDIQRQLVPKRIVSRGDLVGVYRSWWNEYEVRVSEDFDGVYYDGQEFTSEFVDGALEIRIGDKKYSVGVEIGEHEAEPSFWQRFLHVFGWENGV